MGFYTEQAGFPFPPTGVNQELPYQNRSRHTNESDRRIEPRVFKHRTKKTIKDSSEIERVSLLSSVLCLALKKKTPSLRKGKDLFYKLADT